MHCWLRLQLQNWRCMLVASCPTAAGFPVSCSSAVPGVTEETLNPTAVRLQSKMDLVHPTRQLAHRSRTPARTLTVLSQPPDAKRRTGGPGALPLVRLPRGTAGAQETPIAPSVCAPSICGINTRLQRPRRSHSDSPRRGGGAPVAAGHRRRPRQPHHPQSARIRIRSSCWRLSASCPRQQRCHSSPPPLSRARCQARNI